MANVAILGYGTVGSGVFCVLDSNADIIEEKAGERVTVKYVLDIRDFENDPVSPFLTKDFEKIINDDSVEFIAEVMGGIEPAYSYTKALLQKGKSVVTSNKELVASHGVELVKIARENKANYFFEASVGGGIPIIRPMVSSLTAEGIKDISGILNGTTNYILTKMAASGRDFAEVLKEAQELGYAEKNPAADVEGHDACRKISILSSLACGKNVDYKKVHTEGITNISKTDMLYAKSLSSSIKLLGRSKITENGVCAIVAPYLVPLSHPLSVVNDVFNGIFVKGNMVGDTMYYGRGAGKLPTASAVCGDIIDAVKHRGKNIKIHWSSEEEKMVPFEDYSVKALIRLSSGDNKKLKEEALKVFSGSKSIEIPEAKDELGILTAEETEGSINKKLCNLKNQLPYVKILNIIRMEG
ncbi:MAG: homoserine dehydrogenase [Lachnospiraceae bacterium]|nr:homoserine dehydrogenase [Lachnospiraceae bacterium]